MRSGIGERGKDINQIDMSGGGKMIRIIVNKAARTCSRFFIFYLNFISNPTSDSSHLICPWWYINNRLQRREANCWEYKCIKEAYHTVKSSYELVTWAKLATLTSSYCKCRHGWHLRVCRGDPQPDLEGKDCYFLFNHHQNSAGAAANVWVAQITFPPWSQLRDDRLMSTQMCLTCKPLSPSFPSPAHLKDLL